MSPQTGDTVRHDNTDYLLPRPSRRIILFPGFAIQDRHTPPRWNGQVSGVACSLRSKRLPRRVMIRVLGRLMEARPAELQTDLFHQRTEPFFLAPAKAARVQLAVGGRSLERQIRTKRNGQFRARLRDTWLDSPGPGQRARATATLGDTRSSGPLHLLPAEGLSVISDIDDTIKFSNVENRAELLANTFLREFRPIEGMSDVYTWMASRAGGFHYVTASPWQLHQPLEQFLTKHGYPAGSMHYRTFRLSDHLLKRLGVIHRGGKSRAVRQILASSPGRQFVLIGDSGEKDPEIYIRCYRDYPHAIRRILIRLVRPDHRYRESIIRARIALPSPVFSTFETAEQLGNLLDQQP